MVDKVVIEDAAKKANISTSLLSKILRGKSEVKQTPIDVLPPKVEEPIQKCDSRKYSVSILRDLHDKLAYKEPILSPPKQDSPMLLEPTLVLSDLHFGKRIDWNGNIIFDINIARENMERLAQKAIAIPEYAGYEKGTFHLVLGGDIVDGEMIFPNQAFQLDGPAYAQVVAATQSMSYVIETILTVFPKVVVHCVAGNHGRAGHANDLMSNWDNVVYYGLNLIYASNANVDVRLPLQLWSDYEILGHRFHLRHIGVPSGTPAQVGKVSGWKAAHEPEVIIFGHLHTPEMFNMCGMTLIKNGALTPLDEFSERLGYHSYKGMWLFGTTTEEAVTFARLIKV